MRATAGFWFWAKKQAVSAAMIQVLAWNLETAWGRAGTVSQSGGGTCGDGNRVQAWGSGKPAVCLPGLWEGPVQQWKWEGVLEAFLGPLIEKGEGVGSWGAGEARVMGGGGSRWGSKGERPRFLPFLDLLCSRSLWSECVCPPNETYMLKSQHPKVMVSGGGRYLSH